MKLKNIVLLGIVSSIMAYLNNNLEFSEDKRGEDDVLFEEFKTTDLPDGTPYYEVSLYYYDNGISDKIVQNFNSYRLVSTLTELRRLPELPCL